MLKWNFGLLKGVDAISAFAGTGYGHSDVIDWTRRWSDCPIKKLDGIWIVKKRDLRKWLKRRSPPRTEMDYRQLMPTAPKKPKKRRW